jgi:hypothetical protein
MLSEPGIKSSPRSVFEAMRKAADSEITRIIIDFFACTGGVNRFNTRTSCDT